MNFMWLKVALVLMAAPSILVSEAAAAEAMQTIAVPKGKPIFVIRHFQKGPGADPSLSPEGAANAQHLAVLLKDKGVTAIFATPTKRAMETAAPLAVALGISVTPYNPGNPQGLLAAVRAGAGSALIVGHSNTVPDLVAMFGGAKPAALSDDDYGTLFDVEPNGAVSTSLVR